MFTATNARNWWCVPPLPDCTRSTVVADPPGEGRGFWAGAPSAVMVDGVTYLAYRLRRPLDLGRGVANVIARADDGEHFETLAVIDKEAFGSASMERPALAVTSDGAWRLYVSYVDPADSRWRIDLLEASSPAGFDPARRRRVLTGDDIGGEAVKDPVVAWVGGIWHMWASCHRLTTIDDKRRAGGPEVDMSRAFTGYATSSDGLGWEWHGTALTGHEGRWDEHAARITSVLLDGVVPMAFYDGRPTGEQNYEEYTGIAFGTGLGTFDGAGQRPVATSPYGTGCLRYLAALPTPGGYRLYYEMARADGSHELRTQLVPSSG